MTRTASSSSSATRRPPLRRWILPLLTVAALLVSVVAIAVDDVPSHPADSVVGRATGFAMVLAGDHSLDLLKEATLREDKIPPLAVVIVGLLLSVLGNSLMALRLGGVLCLALLALQCRDLALRCGASRNTGQWAALLCSTTPMLFGWARLDYADIYVAVFFVACLQVMARGYLTRRRAVGLGVLGGLGVLTKLSFFVYILGPAVFFVWAHLRRGRGQWLNLGLALLCTLVISGWWIALRMDRIYQNFFYSTQSLSTADSFMFLGQSPLWIKLDQITFQLWRLPGLPALWLGAAAGLLLWRGRPRRLVRTLLGLGSLLGLGVLMAFDPGARYMVPLMPPAVVLAALAVERVLHLARPRLWPLEPILVLGLLGWFAWTNLTIPAGDALRFNAGGMLRPVRAYTASCKLISRDLENVAVWYEDFAISEWLNGILPEAGRSCAYPPWSRDTSKPCQLVVSARRQRWPDDLSDAHRTRVSPPGCPDLKRLNRLGEQLKLEFWLKRNWPLPLPRKRIVDD
jgi:4-amino-4-deoxy-L-arabinose transferase-like glycosyltransferase